MQICLDDSFEIVVHRYLMHHQCRVYSIMYEDSQDSFCLKETKPCNTRKSRYYLTFIYFLPPALDSGPLYTLHNYTSISTITLVHLQL